MTTIITECGHSVLLHVVEENICLWWVSHAVKERLKFLRLKSKNLCLKKMLSLENR